MVQKMHVSKTGQRDVIHDLFLGFGKNLFALGLKVLIHRHGASVDTSSGIKLEMKPTWTGAEFTALPECLEPAIPEGLNFLVT